MREGEVGNEAYLTYLGDACTIYTVLELPEEITVQTKQRIYCADLSEP